MPRPSRDSKRTAVAERPVPRRGTKSAARPQGETIAARERTPLRRTWRQRLREFRFLAVIVGASLALAFYETSREDLPKTIAEVPSDWLMDEQLNMAHTLTELYPERSYGFFLRSYQAAMCWDQSFAPPVCNIFAYKDLRDVRNALEEAIARGGSGEQEELFHFYAYILARSNESPERVDEAILQWRRHYPHSKKPDPRQMAAANTSGN